MKIPTESDGGKLVPHSIKCVLIGYFGHDAYRLLDRTMGKLFRSQDVIFEEGTGHRTLDAPPVSNEGETDHVILQPTGNKSTMNPANVTTPIPQQTVLSVPQPATQVI